MVDAVVLRRGALLVVRRHADAPVAPRKWALPGGFVATSARRGERWMPGRETAVEACVRELREETGLVVDASRLVPLGIYERGGRDPRDTERDFARSSAFVVTLDDDEPVAISGGDDADDARWFALDALPRLAFDHARIVRDALASLRRR